MDDETSQTFIELPLEDAVRQLSKTHGIPMVIDRRALEEIGLTPDQPVTISLQEVSLRAFLRLMLRELDLSYVVENEVLIITTTEAAKNNLMLETYVIPPILAGKGEQVVMALTTTVHSAQWERVGGPCAVAVIENVVVVSATQSVHGGVEEFFAKVESALAQSAAQK
ncbi:MAG: DUF4974 domain-containing protein [Pirellulales bacterium]|nr:DUF4974 domain-containing protein [Pirellulales bacterium]